MAEPQPCLGVVVITHGVVGQALVAVADHILAGRLRQVRVVTIPFLDGGAREGEKPWQERRQGIEAEVATAVHAVDQGPGILVLTDILGGTAFTVARQLTAGRQAALVAGVNLPMLLKLPSLMTLPVAEAAAALTERSRRAIDLFVQPRQG
ncbi:MAG: hypothetical protein AB1634_03075 [Thermodesulfobacteriota bacterium]